LSSEILVVESVNAGMGEAWPAGTASAIARSDLVIILNW